MDAGPAVPRPRRARALLRELGGDFFEHNSLSTALSGRRSGRTYRLGDPIEVRVQELRRAEGKVEVALAEGARR